MNYFHNLFRTAWLLTVVLFTACNDGDHQTSVSPKKPNILFILADDLGYGDLTCFGSHEIETPNLDALASTGIQLRNFYASSAVCTPSRAAILSGKYPIRFDIRHHFRDETDENLPAEISSMAWMLKKGGYFTAHIGKWHLGGIQEHEFNARAHGDDSVDPGPMQHGFDHYLCFIEDTVRKELFSKKRLYRDGGLHLVRNERRIPPVSGHWTDIKTDETIFLIDSLSRAGQPFFINLWYDVPHTPYEPAPAPHTEKYKARGFTGNKLLYNAMVSHMDAGIGRIVKRLKGLGELDNTLIVFTSDNGPAYFGSTGYFSGGKADLHEGGIRVPFIAAWPGNISSGVINTNVVASNVDLLPTFCKAAGVDYDGSLYDGENILPWLTGAEKAPPRREIFWQLDFYSFYPQPGDKPKPYATTALLKGSYKLLADSLEPVELFDLADDPSEMKNKVDEFTDIRDSLAIRIQKYLSDPRIVESE